MGKSALNDLRVVHTNKRCCGQTNFLAPHFKMDLRMTKYPNCNLDSLTTLAHNFQLNYHASYTINYRSPTTSNLFYEFEISDLEKLKCKICLLGSFSPLPLTAHFFTSPIHSVRNFIHLFQYVSVFTRHTSDLFDLIECREE